MKNRKKYYDFYVLFQVQKGHEHIPYWNLMTIYTHLAYIFQTAEEIDMHVPIDCIYVGYYVASTL